MSPSTLGDLAAARGRGPGWATRCRHRRRVSPASPWATATGLAQAVETG